MLSQEQYDIGRQELERRLLEDVTPDGGAAADVAPRSSRVTGIVAAVLIPLTAVSMYLLLGNQAGLTPDKVQTPQMSGDFADQINRMVKQLATRLQANPEDGEGWKMLGRSYLALEKFDKAREAFEEAAKRLPQDAQVMADLADAVAMTTGESLQGRPMQLIRQALAIDPANQKALWLAGTAAYEQQDYRKALEYWQRLRDLMPPGSEGAQSMDGNIEEARSLLRQRGEEVPPEPASTLPQASGSGTVLAGTISLDSALADKVRPDDSLFIFAQAAQGPRVPLAVLRVKAGDLPYTFKLDDSMAMMASASLSRYDKVVVTARVSRSGNASPVKGDLQGHSDTVSHDAQQVKVVINEVVP